MASDDRNTQYENLTVTDSLTDPGGTEHTGSIDGGGGSGVSNPLTLTAGSDTDDVTVEYEDETDTLRWRSFMDRSLSDRLRFEAPDTGNVPLELYPGGSVRVTDGNLGLNANRLIDVTEVDIDSDASYIDLNLNATDDSQSVGIYDQNNSRDIARFNQDGSAAVPNGELTNEGNRVLTTADRELVASGVTTLTDGADTISTGVTTTGTHIDVSLDPSGDGANTADVKVAARAVWNDGTGEYEVEILEDGTDVGNPDIGYEVYA